MNKYDDTKTRDRAIRPAELQQILGISKSSIHRLEASGVLPKKRKYIGGVSCFYLESEILNFLRNQQQVDGAQKTTLQVA